MTTDGRAFPRYAYEAEIRIRWGTVELMGVSQNLSRGGLAAMVFSQIPAREAVVISMRLRFPEGETSEALSLPARVVWCTGLDDKYQVGVAFQPLDAKQSQFLEVFLRMLNGEVEHKTTPMRIDDKFRDD